MNRREFLKSLLATACVGAAAPLDALAAWSGESVVTFVDVAFDDSWTEAISIGRGSPMLIDNWSLEVTLDLEKVREHTYLTDDAGGEWRIVGDFEGLRGPNGEIIL